MTKVAVTGGAGFVGTNLVRRLVERGHEVRVIDDFSTGMSANLAEVDCAVIEASITDVEEISRALKGSEYIFHLAARGSVPRSLRNPRSTLEVNVTGTLNVLECARQQGASVAFSSSSSVYGSNLELPKRENMWTSPLTPYAASKLAAEGLIQSFALSYGIKTINFRFFNIFGPWQRPDHDYAAVIPKWIWQLMNGQNRIEVFGDGSQSRDFTYIDSVIEILIKGMEAEIIHPQPLNLAFGERISLMQLIEILKGYFPELEVDFREPRAGDVKNSQNDPSELHRVFPNVERVDFELAIRWTIEWFEKYGERIANGPKVLD
jgi:UDP-glucose 4-epimerase